MSNDGNTLFEEFASQVKDGFTPDLSELLNIKYFNPEAERRAAFQHKYAEAQAAQAEKKKSSLGKFDTMEKRAVSATSGIKKVADFAYTFLDRWGEFRKRLEEEYGRDLIGENMLKNAMDYWHEGWKKSYTGKIITKIVGLVPEGTTMEDMAVYLGNNPNVLIDVLAATGLIAAGTKLTGGATATFSSALLGKLLGEYLTQEKISLTSNVDTTRLEELISEMLTPDPRWISGGTAAFKITTQQRSKPKPKSYVPKQEKKKKKKEKKGKPNVSGKAKGVSQTSRGSINNSVNDNKPRISDIPVNDAFSEGG